MPKLTKRSIERIRPHKSEDLYVYDDQIPGFGVRVKPSGIGGSTGARVIQMQPQEIDKERDERNVCEQSGFFVTRRIT